MELSDSRSLDALLDLFAGTRRPSKRSRAARMTDVSADSHAYVPPANKLPARRNCRCGRCGACVDNARWEAIFQAKFADPNYYDQLAVRHRSPLNTW